MRVDRSLHRKKWKKQQISKHASHSHNRQSYDTLIIHNSIAYVHQTMPSTSDSSRPSPQQLHEAHERTSQVLPSKLRQFRRAGRRLHHPRRPAEVLRASWVRQGCEARWVLLDAWAVTAEVRPRGRVHQGRGPGRTVHESRREEKETGVLLSGRRIVRRQRETVRQARSIWGDVQKAS
jgi:hypothetical protein